MVAADTVSPVAGPPSGPPFDPAKMWTGLIAQGMSRQQAQATVQQHIERAQLAQRPDNPQMPGGISALAGLAQGSTGQPTQDIDPENKVQGNPDMLAVAKQQAAGDSTFQAQASAANPGLFELGKLTPDAIMAVEGMSALGGFSKNVALAVVGKLGGPILRAVAREAFSVLRATKPELGETSAEIAANVVRAAKLGVEPEVAANTARAGLPDQAVQQLARAAQGPEPAAAKAANEALNTFSQPQTPGAGAGRLAEYQQRLAGLTKTELQSHLNWTQNRIEQGPWMKDNLRAIVQEMAKRGMVSR